MIQKGQERLSKSKSLLGSMTMLAPVPHPTTNFAPIWLAETLGYAKDEGLDFRIELVGTPKNAADGVISGLGDTTFINVVFTLLARDRGIPLRPYYGFVRRQNRSFSVPQDSLVQDLQDLRGKMIGLHYDDPELFEFAKAALRGAGVDPDREVRYMALPGTPLDAPRMAAALRDGSVDAVWQLDVFAGLMEGEELPMRLLPSKLIDPLTPSSCLNALDERLEERPEAYGALGRAIAKATIFAINNPEDSVRMMWSTFSDSAPASGQDVQRAFNGELYALKVRLAGHAIDDAPDARWGAITRPEIEAWQDFLLKTGAIGTRRDPSIYYSDALVEAFNDFDAAPVIEQARKFHD
jgi:NitT/TauT family transport system substrate-binding protein